MRVIGELLDVPSDYWSGFRAVMEPILTGTSRDDKATSAQTMTDLLTKLIAYKRRNLGADLLSALVDATEDGDRLSEHELLATTYLLLIAGYDTTVNLIGNGVLALLRNPAQLSLLHADRSLMTSAVEELLRFDGPVNIATLRFTTAAVQVGDVAIPENEFVIISLLAANRDPLRFEEPNRLDISRARNAHIAFGHGIHHCVGAPLARMEGRIALERLLAHFSRIELDSTTPLVYRDSTLMRGLTALPVRCSRT